MKKIISLILALLLVLVTFTSCDFELPDIFGAEEDDSGAQTGATTAAPDGPADDGGSSDQGGSSDTNVQDPPATDDDDIGGEPQINYGTLASPVTTTYATTTCGNLANGESSAEPFYVKGRVTDIGEDKGNYYKNVYFTDGTNELLIYTINMGDGIDGFDVGDTIIAYGYIKNYNGTIEMATYNSSVYVYVVKVEAASGDQGGNDSGNVGDDETGHAYTDFTSDEKALFNSKVGLVIPFIPNDKYYVEEYSDSGIDSVNFYAYGNTQAEFDAYRALFSAYTYDGSDVDEYDTTWYYYSKGNVYVDMAFYYSDSDYVVDIYVYLASEDDGGGEDEDPDTNDPTDTQINYGTLSAPVTTTYAKGVCSSLASGASSASPFYVKGRVTDIGEDKGNYYKNVYFTDGTTEMLIFTINMSNGIDGFDVGDTIIAYGYIKNYNGTIEMATYNSSVYVYVVKVEYAGGGNAGSGSTGSDSNIITNDGKGLPESDDGIYDVDFTRGEHVQNVTDQGYYLDGCPTTGAPAVLVIPVEFSNATAASKGYTVANLEKIFNGGSGDTIYYSVHDYFFVSSYEKLDLDITVLSEWFRPKNNSSYYENATEDIDGQEMPIGDQLILDEALAYLATIMDLSKFDSDNNGIIDAVVMVNTLDIGEDDFHWAYRYWNYYTNSNGECYEYDGVSANDYIWMSYEFMFEEYDSNGDVNFDHSNPQNPYTFIHEFSHILGADDYYDIENKHHPLGGYDIMDDMAGDHNPYSKFNYGWVTDSKLIVTDSSVTLDLAAFSKSGETVILANNWDDALGAYQEYYVVMYYTAADLNAGIGGYFTKNAVLVYHVNASLLVEEYNGNDYYYVYNTNTSASGEYGTEDNLIEYVLTSNGHYTYVAGDSLPTVTDDSGNTLGYTFTVNSLDEDSASITFTKK